MFNSDRSELIILASILLPSLVAGLLVENILLFSLLGLVIYLTWHLYRLLRLSRLIRQRRHIHSPFPPGLWGEIHRALERAQSNERKHKQSLVRFISRFRKATTAMSEGLVLLNQNQQIDWANPAAGTLLNISLPADEGRSILNVLRFPFLEEYLSAVDFSHPLEFPSPDHSGMVISLQVIAFGKRNRHGLLLVVQDITQVFNLNQIRRDFVANVSHELRTPLTVIAGFVENLIYAAKYPAQERPLLLIQQQSRRMETTIDDLLTLSRLEMEQGERIQNLVRIPVLLEGLIEEARNLSGSQNHNLLAEIDQDLGLLGNEHELRSVFSNLIFNAVKHTPPRANIRIVWKFDDTQASFIITDSGEGIVARHIPRLTERFYRVDQGRSRESGGTGLGLAIVKHGVFRHGGKLDIQSEVGMGSTFRCDFPEGIFCFLASADSEDRIPG